MYPCCILIMLILLHFWGAKEKALIIRNYLKNKFSKNFDDENTPEKSLRKSLEEAQQQYSILKKTRKDYSDGRTKIIDLREDRAVRSGDQKT